MKNLLFVSVLLIFVISLFADWSIEQKVFADDGAGEDYFGESVSISGNYAIVGARFNDYPSGSAYLYHKEGNDWYEIDKIKASDSTNVQYFGSSVFINGNYMIISANHGYNNSSGAVYIYHNDGENWNEMDIVTASGSPICDQYGCSVSISEDGDYAIVGAFNDDENGEGFGAAYVYQRDGSEWNLQIKIMAFDGFFYDLFGYSVFIYGNYIFIGAINDDDNGDFSGSVYIYQNVGANWEFHSKLIASNYSPSDRFGNSISASNDYLIIGTCCYDQGEAYIFHFDGVSWTEETILTASDGFNSDHFGIAVSISDDFVVVGAKDSDDVGMSSAAYFFERQDSDWVELNKINSDDWFGFGYAVSISGDNAIVGAYADYGITYLTGAAYLITNDGTSANMETVNNFQNRIIAFPNPFNPETTISFSLAEDAKNAKLEIYNLKGQKIRQYSISNLQSSIVWDGKDDKGKNVTSGIFLYSMKADKYTSTRKMILLK